MVRASARILVVWGKVMIVELGESVQCASGDSAVGFTTGPRCPSLSPVCLKVKPQAAFASQVCTAAAVRANVRERELSCGKSS